MFARASVIIREIMKIWRLYVYWNANKARTKRMIEFAIEFASSRSASVACSLTRSRAVFVFVYTSTYYARYTKRPWQWPLPLYGLHRWSMCRQRVNRTIALSSRIVKAEMRKCFPQKQYLLSFWVCDRSHGNRASIVAEVFFNYRRIVSTLTTLFF